MKFILVKESDGSVSSSIDDTDSYHDGLSLYGYLYIDITNSPESADHYRLKYYKNGEFKPYPEKPSDYHFWNIQEEFWDAPIDYIVTYRKDASIKINKEAGIKITTLYPVWKQHNVERSPDAPVMFAYIDSIRDLSNIANAAIELAVDVAEIRMIESQFTTDLQNL